MEYIVDFQAFQLPPNEFAVEELAILPLKCGATPSVYFFKPPCDFDDLPVKFKVTNAWLIRNHLCMPWDSGIIPYDLISKILRSSLKDALMVYVKGAEKAEWLRRYVDNVCDITDSLRCPSLKALRTWKLPKNLCIYHPEPGS